MVSGPRPLQKAQAVKMYMMQTCFNGFRKLFQSFERLGCFSLLICQFLAKTLFCQLHTAGHEA